MRPEVASFNNTSTGVRVTALIKAQATPMAAILPKVANDGELLRFRLKKPMLVVMLVSNNGMPLKRKVCSMASRGGSISRR